MRSSSRASFGLSLELKYHFISSFIRRGPFCEGNPRNNASSIMMCTINMSSDLGKIPD
jgi:hypothetical protein